MYTTCHVSFQLQNNRMKKDLTYPQALSKAMALCSLSEQCSSDIRDKVMNWGISPDDADKIISLLKSENFINDSRYARAYCRDKHNFNGWGKIKISYNLRKKGLGQAIIDDAFENIDYGEYDDKISSLLKSKLRTVKGKDYIKTKAALYRYGISRGFEPDIVMRHVNKLLGNKDEE